MYFIVSLDVELFFFKENETCQRSEPHRNRLKQKDRGGQIPKPSIHQHNLKLVMSSLFLLNLEPIWLGTWSHQAWVCKERPMFAKISTQWFPFIYTWVTMKFIEETLIMQFSHLFFNCQGTILDDSKAKATKTEYVFQPKMIPPFLRCYFNCDHSSLKLIN